MTQHLGAMIRAALLATTVGTLLTPVPAKALPICGGGYIIRNSAGTAIGCLFYDPNWVNGEEMCTGTAIFHSTGDGACHICVAPAYATNIQNGNWGGFSVSGHDTADFRCLSCKNPPNNLVGWWNFDDNYNDVTFEARDTVPNGDFMGVFFNGPPSTTSGRYSRARQFDGVNDYVEIEDHPTLDFGIGKHFTVDAWVRVGAANDLAGVRTILDKRETSPTLRGYSFFLYNGRPGIQLADGLSYGNYIATSVPPAPHPAVPADNQWHLVAVSVSRQNGAKFYIDGIQVGSLLSVSAQPGALINSSPVHIGSHSFGVSSLFKGGLDEVEIFNRVLSDSEIQALVGGKCEPQP